MDGTAGTSGDIAKEEINGVLPLFTPKDKDLEPLISSDFYKLLMVIIYILRLSV